MKVVAEEFGPDSLIFPDLCGQPFADKWLIDKGLQVDNPKSEELSSPTLPNRFLAIIPEDSVKDIADRAKQAVKDTFKDICNAVKTKMAEEIFKIDSSEWDAIWRRQTEDFIETYWAAIPVDNYADFLNDYKPLMGIKSDAEFDRLIKEYEAKGFAPNIGTVYGQIYHLVEKTLGSRKTVRDFKQTDEPNHKCTLCGVREPVHPGTYKNQSCSDKSGALKKWWQEVVLPAFPQIRKSERLCAVCVTKRLSSRHYFNDKLCFEINDNFPSVSMIATASFKLRVIENISYPNLSVAIDKYVRVIKELVGERWRGISVPMVIRACRDTISEDFSRLEGDLLYKDYFENYKSIWEENNNRFTSENDFKNLFNSAKDLLDKLYDTIKQIKKETGKDLGEPSKYYSVLLMDGDNMGKWLSGEYAPTIAEVLHPIVRNTLKDDSTWQDLLKQKRPLNPSLHLATSKALRDFSLYVAREIAEKDHLGKLVYAGGDDVLAFVNLKDLPDVMRKLRAYFSGSLLVNEETNKIEINFKEGKGFVPIDESGEAINVGSGKPIKGFKLSMGTKATASMGVVIAHHNSNLSQVLDEVRQCEKKAKKLKDKNAFCIALAKRAGGTERIQAKWYYDLPQEGIFESIPILREWADAFYNDYMSPKIVYTFRMETTGLEDLPLKAVCLELQRIAKRQWNKKKADKFSEDDLKRLVNGLMILYNKDAESEKQESKLEKMCVLLSVAAFLGREGNR
jgi:CRISPR-associated protein Cmr2